MTPGQALARASPDKGTDFDALELEPPQLTIIIIKADTEAAFKKDASRKNLHRWCHYIFQRFYVR
jgi:hypothetical protein